jgi:hypothetical protein
MYDIAVWSFNIGDLHLAGFYRLAGFCRLATFFALDLEIVLFVLESKPYQVLAVDEIEDFDPHCLAAAHVSHGDPIAFFTMQYEHLRGTLVIE